MKPCRVLTERSQLGSFEARFSFDIRCKEVSARVSHIFHGPILTLILYTASSVQSPFDLNVYLNKVKNSALLYFENLL